MTQPLVVTGRKAKAAETQAALKAAATRVFARRGYLTTKITDITAEAGRAAGSFYNHFDGKESLLRALLADVLAAGDAAVRADDSTHSEDFTHPAAVRWHVETYWRFVRDNTVVLTALRQAALVNEEFGAQVEAMLAEDHEHLAGHLHWITRAGRALPGEPTTTVTAIAALLDGFGQRWTACGGVLGGRAVPEDEVIDMLTTFVYRALNGRDP